MIFSDENQLIAELNKLLSKGYEGYVQFSGCAIDNDCIFSGNNKQIPTHKKGFIFEAHLSDTKKQSIAVRRINKDWYLDEVDITSHSDEMQIYVGQQGKNVKMIQIWESKPDEFCEGMDVLKLEKVVFSGFEKDKK